MNTLKQSLFLFAALLIGSASFAQDDAADSEALKIAALEALMSAPEERALPIVTKVLNSNNSDKVKSRALFVLSQIDMPEAHALLLDTAKSADNDLRLEAIRMIGVAGEPESMGGLREIFDAGDEDVRQAVLSAYMIADDVDAVFEIAVNARNDDEFSRAVNMLGSMNAVEQLRKLKDRPGAAKDVINALAIADDIEGLKEYITDASDPDSQKRAIRALGMIDDYEAGEILLSAYRDADSDEMKRAALNGMMIGDHDEQMLMLYQEATDAREKRDILRVLANTDSEAVWELIDSTLESQP